MGGRDEVAVDFDVLDLDGDRRAAAEMTGAEVLRQDAETRAHMRAHSVRVAGRVSRTIRDATRVERRPVRGPARHGPVTVARTRPSRSPVVRSRTTRRVRRAVARAPGREPPEPEPPAATAAARPIQDEVLRHVRPGYAVALRLPAGFVAAHPDNGLAASILAHHEAARERLGSDRDAPFVAAMIRAVARKLGHTIGTKRANRLRQRLIDAGVLVDAGSYRQRYTLGPVFRGFRVSLYRVARAAAEAVPGTRQASVRPRLRVKCLTRGIRWWETPLGSLDGRPPPGMTERAAHRMTTLDDLRAPGSAAA